MNLKFQLVWDWPLSLLASKSLLNGRIIQKQQSTSKTSDHQKDGMLGEGQNKKLLKPGDTVWIKFSLILCITITSFPKNFYNND